MKVRPVPALIMVWVALYLLPLQAVAGPSQFVREGLRSPAGQTGTLVVEEQQATIQFPERVDFTLKASGFTAARAEMNYRLVGSAVTIAVRAELPGPTGDIDTQVSLDLKIDYIPPGTEVTYYWQLTSPEGETVDTPGQTFKMEDPQHTWQALTDSKSRVQVHWYSGGSGFGQQLLATASGALDRLEQEIGATLQRRAEIWIYANSNDLFAALPVHQPEWVGGQAYPKLGVVLAAIEDSQFADVETERMIPHEISHLVLQQATENPYNVPPAWMDEGIAVHNQEVRDPWENETLQAATEEGRLVTLKALSGSFGADEDAALLGYAQSGSVIDFLIEDPRYGAEKLARTIRAFKEGVTYDEALAEGLGVTTSVLDAQWRASLPYELLPPGTPSQARPQVGTPSWAMPLLYVVLGVLAALFVAGGLATVFIVGKSKSKRR